MDRTANPLFKAGMAAITATALVVAPTAVPRTPQAISLPDIRSAAVRLSSFAFTPQADNGPLGTLTGLKYPLPSSAPGASDAPAGPLPLTPITSTSLLAQPRAAAASPATPSVAPSRSSAPMAAAAGPAVANSITNGIDQAYQFIQYWVDYGVDLAQWGAGFVPVIGGLVSAQIGIVYDNLVRPIANSFVYNLVDPIINDPSFSNIVNSFGRFGSDIVNSVINFAWAEARYFLPPLPPLPGLALQATADSVGATPTSIHEALAPFTKAFKDAQAHFAETLGLTKADQKLASLEKTAITAETTTDITDGAAKEDDKTAAATTAAVDSKDRAETKTPGKDKAATAAVDKDAKTDVKAISDTKEAAPGATNQSPKDAPKDATPGSATAGTQGDSGEALTGTKPAKDAENLKDSTKEDKAPTAAVIKDNTDKLAKPKAPAASTTEHGTVSAQGTVRGPISQSTTGHPAGSQNPAGKTSDAQAQGAESKSSETKTSETKTSETKTSQTKTSETKSSVTKPSESKSSGSKPPSASTAHDSASKSAGSASGSSKSGSDGSKSSGGGHD